MSFQSLIYCRLCPKCCNQKKLFWLLPLLFHCLLELAMIPMGVDTQSLIMAVGPHMGVWVRMKLCTATHRRNVRRDKNL